MRTQERTLSAMNCHHRFYELEDFFANAAANGYRAVELWTGPQHFFMDYLTYDPLEKLLDLEQRYGVKIIGICPEQTNPKPNNIAAKDPKMQERVLRYFHNAIDVACGVNANQVVVTSGWAFLNESKAEAFQRSVTMLQAISEYAEEKQMRLAIEALQPSESNLVNNVNDLELLLQRVHRPALKVCLDIGAMAIAKNTIQDYFDRFQEAVIHTHFVDVKDTTTHLAWGDGHRDMKADLKDFERNCYHGILSVECIHPTYFQNPQVADARSMSCYQQTIKEMGR